MAGVRTGCPRLVHDWSTTCPRAWVSAGWWIARAGWRTSQSPWTPPCPVSPPALEGRAVLTKRDLSFNRLGAAAGKALAGALEVNEVLKKCDLQRNGLGAAGEQAVQDAVKGREGFELLV